MTHQTRLEEDSNRSGGDTNPTAGLFPSFLILHLQLRGKELKYGLLRTCKFPNNSLTTPP